MSLCHDVKTGGQDKYVSLLQCNNERSG